MPFLYQLRKLVENKIKYQKQQLIEIKDLKTGAWMHRMGSSQQLVWLLAHTFCMNSWPNPNGFCLPLTHYVVGLYPPPISPLGEEKKKNKLVLALNATTLPRLDVALKNIRHSCKSAVKKAMSISESSFIPQDASGFTPSGTTGVVHNNLLIHHLCIKNVIFDSWSHIRSNLPKLANKSLFL